MTSWIEKKTHRVATRFSSRKKKTSPELYCIEMELKVRPKWVTRPGFGTQFLLETGFRGSPFQAEYLEPESLKRRQGFPLAVNYA